MVVYFPHACMRNGRYGSIDQLANCAIQSRQSDYVEMETIHTQDDYQSLSSSSKKKRGKPGGKMNKTRKSMLPRVLEISDKDGHAAAEAFFMSLSDEERDAVLEDMKLAIESFTDEVQATIEGLRNVISALPAVHDKFKRILDDID